MARLRQIVDLPEMNFFAFAVLLNFPWEFLQVPLFEGMADASHWDAIRICTRATLGDGLIMLVAYWVTAAAWRDRRWFLHPRPIWLVAFVGVGVAVTVSLEQLALVSDRPDWGWRYAESMPVIPIVGIGLSPILQWLLLPLLVVWLVRRQLEARMPLP